MRKFIRPDHEIVVDDYGDPKVTGITCYVSRAKTGAIKAGLDPAEGESEALIAGRQNGPVSFVKPLSKQDEVFDVSLSLLNDLRSSAPTVSLMKCNKFIVAVALTMARE